MNNLNIQNFSAHRTLRAGVAKSDITKVLIRLNIC